MKIYSSNKGDFFDVDAQDRGYRGDIYVNINNNFYNINVYDNVRIQQDFETEYEENGFFDIEPNVIIVKSVDVKTIFYTIENLYKRGFFDSIKKLEDNHIPHNLYDFT